MKQHDYAIYDVFTDTALAGNPLAVVFEADDLDAGGEGTPRMQAIAREFNLSETVFVLKPASPGHAARIRIFTPAYEMPFAGHPTVGTAIALTDLGNGRGAEGRSALLVLEENIGPVRCAVTRKGGPAFAEFDLPQLPVEQRLDASPEALGAALGLDPQEIGFENHRPSLNSAGVPYLAVPVSGLAAAARVRVDRALWSEIALGRADGKLASAYVYCRETVNHDCQWHARMFVVGEPSYEDPATGSAAAAFSGVVIRFDGPVDGTHPMWIEQGIEMGRASRIRLELTVEAGRLAAGRIEGHAVKVAEGRLI